VKIKLISGDAVLYKGVTIATINVQAYNEVSRRQYIITADKTQATTTMVKTYTGIIWFDADRWIGSEVVFDDHLSKWRLDQKLNEAADYED